MRENPSSSRLRPSLEHLHLCLLGVPISVTIPLTGFSPLCLCPCASHHLEYERNMAGPCMCFLVVQTVKTLPVMWETQVRSLDQKDPLEKGMATHSSILSWRILWLEEPGGLQSMGSQRVRHNWGINNFKWAEMLSIAIVQIKIQLEATYPWLWPWRYCSLATTQTKHVCF